MRTPRFARHAAAIAGLALPALLVASSSGAQEPHHSKTKGAVVGGATGAVVGGPVGAVAGAAVGAEVQHHRNVKARRRAARAARAGH